MEPVEISAGRLHLRPWSPYDEDVLLRGQTDPEVVRWTPVPVPFTREDARRCLTETWPRQWAEGTTARWAVCDSVSADVLAYIGLHGIHDGTAEVGYWSLPEARGTGATTEAVGAVCRWGFAVLDLQVVEAIIAVGNWASRAVAEKAGFTVDGVRRRHMTQRGALLDAWGATLLREEEMVDRRAFAVPDLTDGVVRLRPFRPEDAADVARACEDPVSAQWLPMPSPYTLADGRAYVEQICPTGWADGTEATFAVVDAATGELLGDCGLKLHARPRGGGVGGYGPARGARGRGVAGRAAALVGRWGLDTLGLSRVELLADVENIASIRAAEKAGYVREGIARAARPDRHGTRHDMAVFSLVRA